MILLSKSIASALSLAIWAMLYVFVLSFIALLLLRPDGFQALFQNYGVGLMVAILCVPTISALALEIISDV